MSEEACTHDCSTCSQNCASKQQKQSLLEPANSRSRIGRVIAVVSGKGGVGKSLITSALAVQTRRMGKKVAILDADITGPSIPKAFGVDEHAIGDVTNLFPSKTETGIELMSVNLLLEDSNDPVVWRGPVIAGVVKQFWTDVVWGDVDYMYVDMPPGTGDVPLTVFQSLPVDGIVIVTSPQELVSMVVEKAVRMAEMMNIPVIGIVENMSGFRCPDCGKFHEIFGASNVAAIAESHGVAATDCLPIDPALAALCDKGRIEDLPEYYLGVMANEVMKK